MHCKILINNSVCLYRNFTVTLTCFQMHLEQKTHQSEKMGFIISSTMYLIKFLLFNKAELFVLMC